MNNAEHKQRCNDCNKHEQPIYEISYTHPTVNIKSLITGKEKTIPGKKISKTSLL